MTPNILQAPLTSFGIEESTISEIPGRAHQTWKIVSTKGIFILKQYKNTDLEALQKTISVIQLLSKQKISIPPFLPNSAGTTITEADDRLYVLSSFIDHSLLLAPNVSSGILQSAAKILGALHKTNPIVYRDVLKPIDFSVTTKAVLDLVVQFKDRYPTLINAHQEISDKLSLLMVIIDSTQSLRETYCIPQFTSQWVCIHGDYTPENILVEQNTNKLFVIDWDNAKIAPRAFEIHKAIGAFCGLAPLNAYLVPVDWKKVEIFLRAYHAVNPFTKEVINEIVTSAAYGSSTYWLRFTLLQTLAEDFRMLDLLPEKIEDCLFWKDNLDTYRRLLLSLLS